MSALSNNVMRRVRFIWLVRTFAPAGVKIGVLALGLWAMTAYVSFGNVWQNAQGRADIVQIYTFVKSAVLNTEFAVQLLLFAAAVLAALLVRDIARNLSAVRILRAV